MTMKTASLAQLNLHTNSQDCVGVSTPSSRKMRGKEIDIKFMAYSNMCRISEIIESAELFRVYSIYKLFSHAACTSVTNQMTVQTF